MSNYQPVGLFPQQPLTPLLGGIGGLNPSPYAPLARGVSPLSALNLGGMPQSTALLQRGLASGPELAGRIVPFASSSPGVQALASQASPATSALSAALGGGGSTGGAGGLLSRFANPTLTKGAALKGAGLAGTGLMASGLIDKTNIGGQNSNLEQGLQGAAIGAGVGAGVGSIFPGIGTAVGGGVGALVGGGAGVLSNIFGGEDKPDADPDAVLAQMLSTAALDDATNAQILDQYAITLKFAESLEGEERKALEAQALTTARDQVISMLGQREQVQQQATNSLALQAQAQNIFEPLAQDIDMSGALYAQAMGNIRDSLPEQYRGIADATVARETSSASRLADAYRAQAALTPIYQQMTQYQQDQNSYAAQLFSQQMAQMAAARTGGGATGAQQDILAALQP